MDVTLQDPILQEWTTLDDAPTVTAPELCGLLAHRSTDELTALAPAMAAAAAELALLGDVPWRFSADDPPVALLRMISRVALLAPDVGGPHCARLAEALDP